MDKGEIAGPENWTIFMDVVCVSSLKYVRPFLPPGIKGLIN